MGAARWWRWRAVLIGKRALGTKAAGTIKGRRDQEMVLGAAHVGIRCSERAGSGWVD